MEYQYLGKSGLKVSKIILGAMSFGDSAWREWVIGNEEEAFALMKRAYDVGIRTFDTANTYSNGKSEELIGKFIKKYDIPRSSLVILSKVNFPCHDDPRLSSSKMDMVNRQGLSRKHILDAIDATCERLGTYVDLYQIHRLDRNVPKEEIMEALHDVIKSGKVRYIGASTMKAVEFAQLQFTAEKHGWTKFISMQNYYNLIYREEEREMIPFCNDTGVGLIPWSPIARGVLAKPLNSEQSIRTKTDSLLHSFKLQDMGNNVEIINRVETLAKKKGISMAQLSIAWALHKGTCPIVGFNKLERIDEAVAAVKFKLTDEDLQYLEEAYVTIAAYTQT